MMRTASGPVGPYSAHKEKAALRLGFAIALAVGSIARAKSCTNKISGVWAGISSAIMLSVSNIDSRAGY